MAYGESNGHVTCMIPKCQVWQIEIKVVCFLKTAYFIIVMRSAVNCVDDYITGKCTLLPGYIYKEPSCR